MTMFSMAVEKMFFNRDLKFLKENMFCPFLVFEQILPDLDVVIITDKWWVLPDSTHTLIQPKFEFTIKYGWIS